MYKLGSTDTFKQASCEFVYGCTVSLGMYCGINCHDTL
uniref:Uncharacterized protein n=1 Tax=Arundo donax TaxID=35708 RepID=A0A0A9H7D8_ARUDO